MKNRLIYSKAKHNRGTGYVLAVLFAMVPASQFMLRPPQSNAAAIQSVNAPAGYKSITGGPFEASGVVAVPEAEGVLFIDDGRPGEVFWMQLGKDGNQTGAIKAMNLGVTVDDPEGITTDGNNFYIVGSQSKAKGNDQHGLVRFKFDPKKQSVEGVEAVSELKSFLVKNIAELRSMGQRSAKNDGINIEGLAWDPEQNRLLLGLRSPVVGGKALVVALKLRNPQGPFSYDNFEAAEMKVIRLSLAGQGIRSIEYDRRSKLFRIISGATESQKKTDFRLWEWSGSADQLAPRQATTFNPNLKPEGITLAKAGDRDFIFVVFDTSGYMRMD